MGSINTSSWSWPSEFWPFLASTPMMVTGTFFTRTTWSSGSASPNSSRAVVWPTMATLADPAISAASNKRPDSSGHSRASR